ncbi:MAG: hypothetical protein ACXQS8_09340 [Candidatus Helarchaeales archaeon]
MSIIINATIDIIHDSCNSIVKSCRIWWFAPELDPCCRVVYFAEYIQFVVLCSV